MTPGAEAVVQLLTARGESLAVAESLTGGLVAAELTAVAGASRAFRGSVTAYATDVKGSLLGVDAALLAARGAVDPDVALGMAHGVRRLLGADWGIATTGVAGPEPQDGKPVGTVFIAVAGPMADSSAVGPFGGTGGNGAGTSGVRDDGREGDDVRGDGSHPRHGTAGGPAEGTGSGVRENAGNIGRLRLNGDRAEIRMETVRSVFGLLLRALSGEHLENAGAQDEERNGGT